MYASIEYRKLGNAAFQSKDYTKALSCYNTALSLDASDYLSLSNMSLCQSKLGLHPHAYETAIHCLNLAPASYAKGWARVAYSMFMLGFAREALIVAAAGLSACPGNSMLTELSKEIISVQSVIPPAENLKSFLRALKRYTLGCRYIPESLAVDDVDAQFDHFAAKVARLKLTGSSYLTIVGFPRLGKARMDLVDVLIDKCTSHPPVKSPWLDLILADGEVAVIPLIIMAHPERWMSQFDSLQPSSRLRVPIEIEYQDLFLQLLIVLVKNTALSKPIVDRIVDMCKDILDNSPHPKTTEHSLLFIQTQSRNAHLIELVKLCERQEECLPVIRRAVMRDMIDLNMFGDWRAILQYLGLWLDQPIDLPLQIKTFHLRAGRLHWDQLRFGQVVEGELGYVHPKCSNYMCTVTSTPAEPFELLCEICLLRHWCSTECKDLDCSDHQAVCSAAPEIMRDSMLKALSNESYRANPNPELAMCCNCEEYEVEPNQFLKCERCPSLYCSEFCRDYDATEGSHGSVCPAPETDG
ncbi:uncharacterized protein BJ171DRAFT_498684 [Polychytrium aggregatum]|uniref:uncharacterized protein n=1 Tax=Polychytrium aggregatum TaxID=110093 RepID=UPI0022FDF5D0|nr:uncharacterized protein BJ171DRAFT_498684 [Polychytrium aggregatum]KAI9206100.1 hypothetical protein BJ171DRAFT_498684 [Polychytrium aggregatum]